jgi:hypothetical protein
MAPISLGAMIGRPEPGAPPMVEVTLTEGEDEHRFWFLPDSARDFAEWVRGLADEADELRLAERDR